MKKQRSFDNWLHSAVVHSRRRFLRLALSVAGVSVVGLGLASGDEPQSQVAGEAILRLNPAFKLRGIDGDAVELSTHQKDGSLLRHCFAGTDAEVLRAALAEQSISNLVNWIGQKRGVANKVNRVAIEKSLASLEQAMLVYRGEKMLVKVVTIVK